MHIYTCVDIYIGLRVKAVSVPHRGEGLDRLQARARDGVLVSVEPSRRQGRAGLPFLSLYVSIYLSLSLSPSLYIYLSLPLSIYI